MRILEQKEIEDIISRGRQLTEPEITGILDELEKKHPGIYRFMYGEPSDAIATMNIDMANLYLDLAFDVVWVYREAFGKIPDITNEEQWVYKKLSLMDAELKSLTNEIPMDGKFRKNLQERFVKGVFPNKIEYRTKKQILKIFGDPASQKELGEMIDGYDPKNEGIMTLITSHSNATFFVTFKFGKGED